ncbi:MAG TPA: RDD family protein [Planctomycetaceae bacterium]|nr:RDD family protein [Planctomycetaceae bacterium]
MDVHDRGLLQLETTIRTPENVELTYALAGAGSRSAAYLVDCFVLAIAAQLLINVLFALVVLPVGPEWGAAISALFAFAIVNGYFIVFEWLMSGQTPGKWLIGIRVIKVGGYSLRFLDVLLRNLMRFVDFLPAFYGIGAASLIMTSRCQRLGDLVAGTLVVLQDPSDADDLLLPLSADAVGEPVLPAGRLATVPGRLIDLAVEFVIQRSQLASRYRQQIAVELSDLIARVGGLPFEPTQSAESFLSAVIRQSGRMPTSESLPGLRAEPPSS